MKNLLNIKTPAEDVAAALASDYDLKMNGVWHTILFGGQRSGGDAYFALDVTDPEPLPADHATKLRYQPVRRTGFYPAARLPEVHAIVACRASCRV